MTAPVTAPANEDQEDLFGATTASKRGRGVVGSIAHARKTDPTPSHDAALKVTDKGIAADQSRLISDTLRAAGITGMTADELDVKLFNGKHTAGKRLPDLARAGFVVRHPTEKRRSRGNINVTVWVHTRKTA